jgi:hypothetical protein
MSKVVCSKITFIVVLLLAIPPAVLGEDTPYTIKRYDLTIDPDFKSKILSLTANITIDNPGLDTVFSFGLNDNYTSVNVKSDSSLLDVVRGTGDITIRLKKRARAFTLTFSLSGDLGRSNDVGRDVIADSSLFLLWSDRFYPIDFDHWATVKSTIILPKNFKVFAPGKLINTEKAVRKQKYVFETSNPAVCISVVADTRWIRTTRVLNGIPMETLLYPESQKYAEQIFSTSGEILQFYSSVYCPYPFDQFSFMTISDLDARRAFCGAVGYSPAYLEKELTTTGYDAHETALLWWCYTLRGSGPGGFQWTEGLGDYAEMLYCQRYHKPLARIFQLFREQYLAVPASDDLLYNELKGNTPQKLIHGKYPWLMQVMRYVIGDRDFHKAMKAIFQKLQFRTFTMDEFIATINESVWTSLDWWRQEWLERRGVPEIEMTSSVEQSSGGYKVTVVLEQLGAVYHIPVEIATETSEGDHREKVTLGDRTTRYSFELPTRPGKITLDPSEWILMKKVN